MNIPNYRTLEEIEADISALSEGQLIALGPDVTSLLEEKMNHPDYVPRDNLGDRVSGWYENLKERILRMLNK